MYVFDGKYVCEALMYKVNFVTFMVVLYILKHGGNSKVLTVEIPCPPSSHSYDTTQNVVFERHRHDVNLHVTQIQYMYLHVEQNSGMKLETTITFTQSLTCRALAWLIILCVLHRNM